MLVELDKKGLIRLVKGTSPYYSIFEDVLVKRCGRYSGGFNDAWSWDESELNKLSEKELFELYNTCVDSWK